MSDPKLPPYSKFCKCASCGEYFTTPKVFSLHRIGKGGDRSCMASTGMRERGLSLNAKGYWAREYH